MGQLDFINGNDTFVPKTNASILLWPQIRYLYIRGSACCSHMTEFRSILADVTQWAEYNGE